MHQRWKRPIRCSALPLFGALVASGLLEKRKMLLSWNLMAPSHLSISTGHHAKMQQSSLEIEIIEQSRKIYPTNAQMGSEQIDHILDVLSPTGNLLVWGLNNDSPYWHNVTSGKVLFLEDDFPLKKDGILWIDHILKRFPFLTAYQVHYSTENSNSDFKRYMADPWTPLLQIENFPSEVWNTVWDVIIVDAPLGCCGMGPARFQSLYMTMKIVRKQLQNKLSDEIHVFVDDYERKIEHEFSQRVFGEKPPFKITNRSAGVSNANQQAHFIFDDNDCVVDESCSASHSGSGRWMILLTVNDGYFDFILNWLAFYKNISEIQHVPVTVFAEDDTVMKKLLNDHRIPSHFDLKRSKLELLRPAGESTTRHETRSLDYESPNYLEMVSTRASLILESLESGFNVLYSDVDTVWLSNPFPYFDKMVNEGVDLMGQLDELPGQPRYPYYCTGFLAISATKHSVNLIHEWEKALKKPQLNQPIFNKLVKNATKMNGFRHEPLSPTAFPHGGIYFKEKDAKRRDGAVVVHNNFVIGHDAKKARFEEHGLWTRNRDLTHRKKIAIITATRSSTGWTSPSNTLFNLKLLPSLQATITEEEAKGWDIHLYVGIDDDDLFWKNAFDQDPHYMQLTNRPSFLRVHPLFFSKIHEKKNKIPFNEVAKVAFEEDAEYFVRINDDTEFTTENWITIGTNALKAFKPPNVGVVGPLCREGNTNILTHDMVHRTHLTIFGGMYYPEVFSNWWLDDWITVVYSRENLGKETNHLRVLVDWRVRHHIQETRYKVDPGEKTFLEGELKRGKKLIWAYLNGINETAPQNITLVKK